MPKKAKTTKTAAPVTSVVKEAPAQNREIPFAMKSNIIKASLQRVSITSWKFAVQ